MPKVGDRVRIVAGAGSGHWLPDGSTVTVVESINSSGDVVVQGRFLPMHHSSAHFGTQLLYPDEYETLQ